VENKRSLVEGYIMIYGGCQGFLDTNRNGEKFGGNIPEVLVSITLGMKGLWDGQWNNEPLV
jgi:hypothetical protein